MYFIMTWNTQLRVVFGYRTTTICPSLDVMASRIMDPTLRLPANRTLAALRLQLLKTRIGIEPPHGIPFLQGTATRPFAGLRNTISPAIPFGIVDQHTKTRDPVAMGTVNGKIVYIRTTKCDVAPNNTHNSVKPIQSIANPQT